jgi:trans-2,3-dihydro-3-hydroxyanthranilate isomerase
MPSASYRVLDVFTDVALEGNPLAVFPDARGIDDATMRRIARELNLSETTFVTPAERGGSARVRIFTPGSELPFAGHPTLGTAAVLRDLRGGGDEPLVLEENVGDVPVRIERDGATTRFWLTSPPIVFERSVDPQLCARALRLDGGDLLDVPPAYATVGPSFVYVALRDRGAVDRADFDASVLRPALPGVEHIQLFAFAPVDGGAYSRMFAGDIGVAEDPATGSATGPLAAYMLRNEMIPPPPVRIVSEQGVKMGRRSLLHAIVHAPDRIEVGGSVVPVIEATLTW